MAATAYVGATYKQRLGTLQDSTIFPGVYVFNDKRHIKPIFFPKVVQTPGPPDSEDSKQDLLLVHGSNDPSSFRPELLPLDVAKVALVLIKSTDSVPDLFRLGPNKNCIPFTHADVAPVSPGLAAVLPSQTESFLLLALPVLIPILFGAESTVRGPVNEGHVDCFENNLEGSSWWLDHIILWSLPVQAAVVADKVALRGKKILPTLRGPVFTNAVFLSSQGVTTDLEEEISLAYSSLKALVGAVDLLNKPPLQVVTTAASKSASGKARSRASDGSVSSTEGDDNTFSAREYRRARFLLASPVLDKAGKFHPPTLTPQGAVIFDIKDTKMANSAMSNIFTSMMDRFSLHNHFIWRYLDQGRVDPLTCALLTHSEFEYLPLANIDAPFTDGRKFRYLFLVPDSKSLALERESNLGSRSHEEMLGERSSNLSKLDKKIRHGHNVFSPQAFAAWMANCAGFQASVYANSWLGSDTAPYNPENTFLFRTFHQFADLVTYGKARQFFKLYTGSPTRILLWLTSVVDQVTILVTSGVSDPMNVNKILRGQYASIPTDKYYEAIDLVNDTTDKFNKIISGTDSAPTCLLVTNYEHDQAQKVSPKASRKSPPELTSSAPPDPKKARINRGQGDFFLWSKEGKMPHPPEADKTKRVCLMHARKGLTCSNPRCPMVHSPPSEWPKSTLDAWIKVIRDTDGLLFNDDTVPHDIVVKTLKIA